jgi:hypothetical protein
MAKQPTFRAVQDPVLIRGYSQRVKALANPADVRQVVGYVSFDHLDPAGHEITDIGNAQRRYPNITVRLDRQANTSAGAANLQVQVNDVALARIRRNQNEGTTIAQVLIPAAVHRTARAAMHLRTHLENVVRSALLSSYGSSGFQYTIEEG